MVAKADLSPQGVVSVTRSPLEIIGHREIKVSLRTTDLETAKRRLAIEAECRSEELAALVEHALLDDLVRPPQDRRRDRKAKRLCGLQVDHELELRGLLNRQIGGLCAFQDLDVISTLASCPA